MSTGKPYCITAALKRLAKATRRVPAEHVLVTDATALCAVLTDDAEQPVTMRVESTAAPTDKHIHLLTLWGALGRHIAELVDAEIVKDSPDRGTDEFIVQVIMELTDQLFRYTQDPELFVLKLHTREMVERFGDSLEAELIKHATTNSSRHGSN